MEDSGTFVMGLFCAVLAVGVLLVYAQSLRTGEPVYFDRGTKRMPMRAIHVVFMTLFFGSLGWALVGTGLGHGRAQQVLPLAILAVVLLIITTIVQNARAVAREKAERPDGIEVENRKKTPVWVSILILVVAIGVIGYCMHMVQVREQVMEGTINGFIEETRGEEFATAWQRFSERTRSRWPLDRFKRGATSSGFTALREVRQVALQRPYKSQRGSVRIRGINEEGKPEHYTILFELRRDFPSRTFDPHYDIHRFTHDTPRFEKSIRAMLEALKSGDLETARAFTFLRNPDPEAENRLLDGQAIWESANNLGILQAPQLVFADPVIPSDGARILQDVLYRLPDNRIRTVRFALEVNQNYPGKGDGIRIQEMQEIETREP